MTEPVSLRTAVAIHDGVALVTGRVRNRTARARGVRVRNRLDGPTLPPRREGRPVAGWDGDCYAAVVAADDELVFGYACPTDHAREQPAVLVAVGDPASVAGDTTGGPTGPARVRGVSRPPAVVSDSPATPADDTANPLDASTPLDASDTLDTLDTPDTTERTEDADRPAPTLPPAVGAWLAAVDQLLRAARAGDLDTAGRAFDTHGPDLAARLDRERARLRAVAERADRLAERAARTDPPEGP